MKAFVESSLFKFWQLTTPYILMLLLFKFPLNRGFHSVMAIEIIKIVISIALDLLVWWM